MSWLARRPQADNPVNYVSVGMNKTLLIVGLGNIGKEYDGTRHNIGFAVADYFVDKTSELTGWVLKKDLKCEFTSGSMGGSRVIVIKPTTFMNNSGEAVQAVTNFYKIPTANILVIHDELDINFGQIRTRAGGSDAGHNGIKSISAAIGADYNRLRIGIGPKKPAQIDSADFVLKKFTEAEDKQMTNLLKESIAMTSEFIFGSGQLTPDTRSFIV